MLYCVRENQHPHAYHSIYLSIFSFSPINISSKISQELMHLGFWNFVQTLGMTTCIVHEILSILMLIFLFTCPFLVFSNIFFFVTGFAAPIGTRVFKVCFTPTQGWSLQCKRKPRCWNLVCFLFTFFFPYIISHYNVMHRKCVSKVS